MNATPEVLPAPRPAKVLPEPSALALFGSVVRAEWTKLRSVRSTMWSLLVTVALVVGSSSFTMSGATQAAG